MTMLSKAFKVFYSSSIHLERKEPEVGIRSLWPEMRVFHL